MTPLLLIIVPTIIGFAGAYLVGIWHGKKLYKRDQEKLKKSVPINNMLRSSGERCSHRELHSDGIGGTVVLQCIRAPHRTIAKLKKEGHIFAFSDPGTPGKDWL